MKPSRSIGGFSLAAALALAAFAGIDAQDETETEGDAPKPEKEREVTDAMRHVALSRALDLAHAVSTAGNYKRRNNYWEGAIRGDELVIIPLQFFAGNDYCIALGTEGDTRALAVTAFDSEGKVLPIVPDERGGRLLLNVRPAESGSHFLRLRLRKGHAFAYGVLTYLYR